MPELTPYWRKLVNRWATLAPIVLILVSLACSRPGPGTPTLAPTSATPDLASNLPSPTPTRRTLPPALVEATPTPGTEIPLNSLITLFFNQPMDRASVEDALSVQAFLISDLVWSDDATLTINPGQDLPPGASLGVQLDTEARAANGLELPEPINLSYQTAGYLDLLQRLPEPGSRDINPTSAIVAAFDHPIVPLGAEPTELPNPLIFDPPAEGRGEWVNTSTFIFYPQPALAGGKTYSIQTDPTLHGIDGNPLQNQSTWSFSTAAPHVELVAIDGGDQPAGLEGPLAVKFNQAMDTANIQANFQVIDANSSPVLGEFAWNETNNEFSWSPGEALQRDTRYAFSLAGQAQALGGTPLGDAYQGSFVTVPELGVISTNPAAGGVINQYEPVVIQFSGPIQAARPEEFITFEPRMPGLYAYYSPDARTLSISGWYDPSTNYTLTLSPELSDPWGSKLGGESGQPFTLKFRTAPLPAGVMVGNGYGIHFLTTRDNALTAQISGANSLPVSMNPLPLDDFLKMESAGGYEFRRNYRLDDPNKWEQAIDTDPDRTQQAKIYLSPDRSILEPGLYFMRLTVPDAKNDDQSQVIVISDTHLALKLGAADALVWAVDLESGAPVANTPITIYDGSRQLASGQTDAQGVFTATFPARPDPYSPVVAILGQPGEENFSASVSTWNNQIDPWNFNLSADFGGPRQQVYLYSDRPIYRPGQTIYFRGVLREAFNGRYTIPEQEKLTVQLNDDNGQTIASQELSLSSYGTIHGQFDLQASLRPANYSLSIPDAEYSYLSIPVADYRKPEINLSVAFPQTEILAGQDLAASVAARYFFDAPAGNVPFSWTLYSYPASFDLAGYQTGLQGADRWDMYSGQNPGLMVASGEAITLPDGTASLDLGLTAQDPQRRRYQLEVTAQDESGLPVSARADVFVNPANYYIGVQPNSWSSRAGEPTGFDLLTAAWDSTPAPNRSLRAEFSAVSWEPDPDGAVDPYWGTTAYVPVYDPIASTDLRTGPDGQARLEFTPPEPGVYQLDVYAAGSAAPRTAIIQWVGGPGQFILPATDDRHIELSLDRPSYQPGDTARLFIPNPFPNPVPALLTIERGIILDHQTVTLQPGGTTLDLPLTADSAPNVYVSVTLLANQQSSLADFRQGYINLPVEPLEQTINVQITRRPEKTGPGAAVELEIQVSDSADQPLQGEFSIAVVDLAALALADPNSVAIVPHYYDQQPLGIRTGLPLTAYAARDFAQAKGGVGGGGGDGSIPQAREKFPDTAYWQAEIVTGPDGKAALSFTLPDTLTTWQIETRGLTADTRVGQAQSQIVTTQDLLIRPVVPRFLVAGDHLQLAAIVQNNTDQSLLAEATLQADGVALDDPALARQPVSLAPGGRQRLTWWVTALDQLSADLIFSVISQDGALQDASRPALGRLPILHYTAPQTYRTAGTLDEPGQRLELVSLPRRMYSSANIDPRAPEGSSLQIELAPSLAAAFIQALDVLEQNDCLCNELTLSRLLANIETYRIFQQFGLIDTQHASPDADPNSQLTAQSLEQAIETDLGTLLNRQSYDGGWSWWPSDIAFFSGETSSDPFLTAYILFGLTQTREAGLLTNSQPIDRAVDYLNQNLPFAPLPTAVADLDRLTLAQFALSTAGRGNPDAMNSIYTARARLSPWSRALLALAYERTVAGSSQANTLFSDLEASATRTAAGAHWELLDPRGANMTSTLTNSAIVAYALAIHAPQSPLLADAARYLIANRLPTGAWDTSYTTAWTLLALNQIMQATDELASDFTFSASLNDFPIVEGQASPLSAAPLPPLSESSIAVPLTQLYPDSPNLLAIERSAGPGRLYYTARLDVSRPAGQAEPLSQGMTLSRQYFPAGVDCKKDTCTPLESASTNQKVAVRLTLTLPTDAYYLRVEDFIPAGAEIIDTRLRTAQQTQGGDPTAALQYDPADPYARGWGWWNFHTPSLYDDHIAWAADYLPKGMYELTYTFIPLQAGEFQVLPARAWQNYFPEVQATSAGALFSIR